MAKNVSGLAIPFWKWHGQAESVTRVVFWIFLLFLPKKVKKWPKNAKNVFLLEKCTLVTLYCSRNGSNIAIEMRLKKVQKKVKKSPKKVKKKSKKGPKKSKMGKKKFKSCFSAQNCPIWNCCTILGLQIVFSHENIFILPLLWPKECNLDTLYH